MRRRSILGQEGTLLYVICQFEQLSILKIKCFELFEDIGQSGSSSGDNIGLKRLKRSHIINIKFNASNELSQSIYSDTQAKTLEKQSMMADFTRSLGRELTFYQYFLIRRLLVYYLLLSTLPMENRSRVNDLQMRRIVSRYELSEFLGKGAYSEVFKAKHLDTYTLFAVKVISNKVLTDNQKVKECINNELSVHHILQNSPHIVRFFELLQTKNNCYFVYEYCEGGTLHDLLKKEGRLQQKRALQIFGQIVEGFKVLRKYNIVHRDLKPQNLLISRGVFKLADFGFCKELAENQMTKTMLGSPLYMAPEVLKGESYSANADIWSLGVLLYEMIQGICPFQSSSIANLISAIEQYPLVFSSNSTMSAHVRRFIIRCLQKDSKQRMCWQELFEQVSILTDRADSLAVSLQSFHLLHKSNANHKDTHPTDQPFKRSNYELYKQNYNKHTKNEHKNDHLVFTSKENTKSRSNSINRNDLIKIKGRQIKISYNELVSQHESCLNALKICMEVMENRQHKNLAQVGSVLKGIRRVLQRIYTRINLQDLQMLSVLSMVKYEMIQLQKMQGDIQKWIGKESDEPDCSGLPSILAQPWALLSNYC